MTCVRIDNIGVIQEIVRYMREKVFVCKKRYVCLKAKDFATEKVYLNELMDILRNVPIKTTFEIMYNYIRDEGECDAH